MFRKRHISIALTFGTTALVNSKKKTDAQRLTAMMILQDIDSAMTRHTFFLPKSRLSVEIKRLI